MWCPYTQRAHRVWCMISVRSNPLLHHIVFTCDIQAAVPLLCISNNCMFFVLFLFLVESYRSSLTPSLPQPVQFAAWKVRTYMSADNTFHDPITNLLSDNTFHDPITNLLSDNTFHDPITNLLSAKSAHIHACRQYISWSYNKPTFNTVHFDRNPLSCSCKGRKSLNDFKFGTFTGRFLSDGAASMAVKRLSQHLINLTVVVISSGGRPSSPYRQQHLRSYGERERERMGVGGTELTWFFMPSQPRDCSLIVGGETRSLKTLSLLHAVRWAVITLFLN